MLLDTPGGPGHPTCRPRGSHGWLPLSPAEPRPADSPFLPSRSPGGPPLPPPHSPTGPPELRAGTPHPPAPCPVPLGADWPWVLSERVKVAQSCPTLDDPMDCSPPGSSVHRILQARIQEWVALPFSRGSSQPRSAGGPKDLLYFLNRTESKIFKVRSKWLNTHTHTRNMSNTWNALYKYYHYYYYLAKKNLNCFLN